jgi:type II secretory pathway pseudopilin PulG
MRAEPRPRGRRGITLFETVVALAIVGMTAVAALTAVGSELRAAERARHTVEAAALATQRVALLDLLTDQELRALPDSVREGRFDEPLDAYRWETTSAAVASEDGVYDVTVRVTWSDGAFALPTRLYRRPLVVSQP